MSHPCMYGLAGALLYMPGLLISFASPPKKSLKYCSTYYMKVLSFESLIKTATNMR